MSGSFCRVTVFWENEAEQFGRIVGWDCRADTTSSPMRRGINWMFHLFGANSSFGNSHIPNDGILNPENYLKRCFERFISRNFLFWWFN
jgi:hypothetical protein